MARKERFRALLFSAYGGSEELGQASASVPVPPQFEQPDAWWDAITSFLDGVD